MPAVSRVGDSLSTGHACVGTTTIASANTDGTVHANGIDIIESLGGEYKGKLKMLMASMIGVDQSNVKNCVSVDGTLSKYEPIFIFRKP